MSRPPGRPRLRIGTRGSPLALVQARAVRDLLTKTHDLGPDDVEVRVIKTTGDQVQDRRLADIGGKGLFTKEIEVALAAREIDLAVHSSKDMLTILPDGLVIASYLEREDARDVLISHGAKTFADLARGASLGTASLRREAQARRVRPDLEVKPLRGNVETRLLKVGRGEFDATILGMAGLKRLGLTAAITQALPVDNFLPAVGQGAIAIETRENDDTTRQLLSAVNHPDTAIAVTAERAFLAVLEGSCRTPIAGHALVSGRELHFRGMILRPDGSGMHETVRVGSPADAFRLGADAGAELKSRAPADFFATH